MSQAINQGAEILVVDDHPVDRYLLAHVFEDLGYTVHQAYSATEAVKALDRHPGIIGLVADIVMPGLDGIRLAEMACELRPGLRVLLVSGQVAAPQPSAFPFLSKPLSPETLRRAVGAIFPANRDDPHEEAALEGPLQRSQ
ncbi:MAG TPA: response regulator [Azospirillaceae bacterium]|nr:response regulator [Azospirillaceae bacterium]